MHLFLLLLIFFFCQLIIQVIYCYQNQIRELDLSNDSILLLCVFLFSNNISISPGFGCLFGYHWAICLNFSIIFLLTFAIMVAEKHSLNLYYKLTCVCKIIRPIYKIYFTMKLKFLFAPRPNNLCRMYVYIFLLNISIHGQYFYHV